MSFDDEICKVRKDFATAYLDECDHEKTLEDMRALGRKWAERRERHIMDLILGEPLSVDRIRNAATRPGSTLPYDPVRDFLISATS